MLMDEPFGAIDPIIRERLQDEFLQLHRTLRKTIIFVTHDIDEAIKMGDLIAIFREGGVSRSTGGQTEVLADPPSDFVARFVGRDRGLKRLARLGEVDLNPVPSVPFTGSRYPQSAVLRDVLSEMLSNGTSEVMVVDLLGLEQGILSIDRISDLLRAKTLT